MSIEKLLMSKSVKLYLLDMINMEYIDIDKSYITPSGTVLFKIDTDKLAKTSSEASDPKYILENTIFDLACNYQYAMGKLIGVDPKQDTSYVRKVLPNDNDEYYISYIVSPVGTEHITTIFVKHLGLMMSPPDDFVTETMNFLKDAQAPEYNDYKSRLNNFASRADEWVREQIREKLIDGKVGGEFRQDLIIDGVYFNRRTVNHKIVVYIINNWHIHYARGFVNWTDIDNGEGAIFVALNE